MVFFEIESEFLNILQINFALKSKCKAKFHHEVPDEGFLSLTLAVDEGVLLTSRSGHFTTKKGWVGPRASMDEYEKFGPHRDLIPRYKVVSIKFGFELPDNFSTQKKTQGHKNGAKSGILL